MSTLVKAGLLLALVVLSSVVHAAPSEYSSAGGYSVTLPYDKLSFTTSASSFPTTTARVIDGYPLAGRIIAATGRNVLLQAEFGGSEWHTIARTDPDDQPMDPCFVQVTKSGEKIALGSGFYKPLYVFPASALSVASPQNLKVTAGVKIYELSYYDAVWRDERYLFLNSGTETGSAIYVIDTEVEGAAAISIAVDSIPGASAGITFDRKGNLITGIGYDYDAGKRTGELRMFSADDIESAVVGNPITYENDGLLLADNVLSAASLTVDKDNNLFVGGGDLFGTTGALGYAAVIDQTVLARVMAGGSKLDRNASGELLELAPDPCRNDDATSVLYVEATDMLIVSANMTSPADACAPVDWSGGGDPAPSTAYFPPDAPDEDDDGVPDGVDTDHRAPDLFGRAELEHFLSAFGASAGDSNYDAALDHDGDAEIGWADYDALLAHWGELRVP